MTPVRFFPKSWSAALCLLITLLSGAGCSKEPSAPPPPPPAEVKTLTTQAESIPSENTHLGRIVSYNSVQVRARIQGIVQAAHFTEGTEVQAGDLLYTIESDTYTAALHQAEAQLESALAEAERSSGFEQRMARLIDSDAISQQEYDNAASSAAQAKAAVTAAQSLVEQARLNLNYTQILAPEAGRVGRSLVANGALVGKDGPTHMTTIDQIDPIYVNFTISDLDALALRRDIESGAIGDDGTRGTVEILLPDGSHYDHPAQVDFSDRLVNQETGTITARAVAENPESRLLPGMFVRANLVAGQRDNVILLPQKAVIKMPVGHVAWVAVDGKAERRDLVMGEWYGDRWIVERGLGPGEEVIVDGTQGLTPGRPINITPYNKPQSIQ